MSNRYLNYRKVFVWLFASMISVFFVSCIALGYWYGSFFSMISTSSVANTIAWFALCVNAAVGYLIWETLRANSTAASAAQEAARAAKESNSIAKEQFELANRAWLAVSFGVQREALWVPNQDFSLILYVNVENSGHTPAFSVDFIAKCLPPDPNYEDAESQIIKFVDDHLAFDFPQSGQIVFPGQITQFLRGVRIWGREDGPPPSTGITPLIVVIVRYRTSDGLPRFTMFAHRLGSNEGAPGKFRSITYPGIYPAKSFGYTGSDQLQETELSRARRLCQDM